MVSQRHNSVDHLSSAVGPPVLAMGCVQPLQGQWGLDVKHRNTGNINVVYPHIHTPASVSPSVESGIGPGPPSSVQLSTVRPSGLPGDSEAARHRPGPASRGPQGGAGAGAGSASRPSPRERGSERVIGGCLPGERQGVIESRTHRQRPGGTMADPGALTQCSNAPGLAGLRRVINGEGHTSGNTRAPPINTAHPEQPSGLGDKPHAPGGRAPRGARGPLRLPLLSPPRPPRPLWSR